MNNVTAFCELVEKQWEQVKQLVEYEQFCESPIAWCKRVGRDVGAYKRRGWTRQDVNRGKFFGQGPSDLAVLSVQNSPTGRMDSRVDKYVRLAKFSTKVTEHAAAAVDYCEDNPKFANIVQPCVEAMLAIHFEWLAWVDDHSNGFDEVEWLMTKSRLNGVAGMLVAIESQPVDRMVLIESELEPRHKTIWQLLKRHGRRHRATQYSDIHSHLLDAGEEPITDETLTKYLKQIEEICQQYDIELDRPPRGKKVSLKI